MVDVSVLIPMRNASPYIMRSLASVRRQGVALEIVVIDDGSTDGSRGIVQRINDPRVRIIDGPGRGIAAALNAGLEAARGRYIARCDSDDEYPHDRLSWQLQWLRDHPEFGAVCGAVTMMTRRGGFIAAHPAGIVGEEITAELRAGVTRTSLCTYSIRAETLRRTGGFREYFVTSEDVDLMLRLGASCRVWFEPRDSYWYRLHEASITHRQDDAQRLFFESIAVRFYEQRRDHGLDDLQRGQRPMPPEAFTARPFRISDQIQGVLLGRAWREFQAGRVRPALWSAFRAILARPSNYVSWRSFCAMLYKALRLSR